MDKQAKNYTEFTEADFICDPLFQQWVLHAESDLQRFWNDFLLNNPAKKKDIEAARGFLLSFKEKDSEITAEYIDEKAQLLQERLDEPRKAKRIRLFEAGAGKKWLRAAVITGVVLSGILLYYAVNESKQQQEQLSVVAEHGNIKTLVLPDSSSVVLNANSGISYNSQWNENNVREIWLKGEAFFSVKHFNSDESKIKPGDRFVVHTEKLTVSVLGTSFDIRERRGKTEVVLQTGSIKIGFPDNAHPDMLLVPGDHLTYLHSTKELVKTTVKPEQYSAWKEKVLLLKNPTLEEIIYYLEDTYGKKFIMKDKKLASRVIEGPIQLNNLDNTLFIISTVLNVETIQKEDTIIIRSK